MRYLYKYTVISVTVIHALSECINTIWIIVTHASEYTCISSKFNCKIIMDFGILIFGQLYRVCKNKFWYKSLFYTTSKEIKRFISSNQWNKHTFKKCKWKYIPPLILCLKYCQNGAYLQTIYQTLHRYQSRSGHELFSKGNYNTAKIESNLPLFFFVFLVRRWFTCVFWILVGTSGCLGRIHFLSRGIRVRSRCARLSIRLGQLGWCAVPLRGVHLDLLGWCTVPLRGVRLFLRLVLIYWNIF